MLAPWSAALGVAVGASVGAARSPPPPVDAVGRSSDAALAEPVPPGPHPCPHHGERVYLWPLYAPSKAMEIVLPPAVQQLVLPPDAYELSWLDPRLVSLERTVQPLRINILADRIAQVPRLCLDLAGRVPLHVRESVPLAARTDFRQGTVMVGLAGGRRFGEGPGASRVSLIGWTGEVTLVVALTDRLLWPTLPALAYRFDGGKSVELIPWIGMYNWGFSIPPERVEVPFLDPGTLDFTLPDFRLIGFIGAGLDVRVWVNSWLSLIFSSASTSSMQMSISEDHRVVPHTWRQTLVVGLSATLPRQIATFNLAFGLGGNWLFEGTVPTVAARGKKFDFALEFGSFNYLALRHLPLVQVHVTDTLHLEAYASGSYRVRDGMFGELYMLGIGGVW